MSDAPKHIWFDRFGAPWDHEIFNGHRYTPTSGPEWGALMARARRSLAAPRKIDFDAPHPASVLRDLLAYFGEKP